jgi:hypothetical protein
MSLEQCLLLGKNITDEAAPVHRRYTQRLDLFPVQLGCVSFM